MVCGRPSIKGHVLAKAPQGLPRLRGRRGGASRCGAPPPEDPALPGVATRGRQGSGPRAVGCNPPNPHFPTSAWASSPPPPRHPHQHVGAGSPGKSLGTCVPETLVTHLEPRKSWLKECQGEDLTGQRSSSGEGPQGHALLTWLCSLVTVGGFVTHRRVGPESIPAISLHKRCPLPSNTPPHSLLGADR